MPRRRTEKDRRRDREEAERLAWERFRPRLEGVKDYVEAKTLTLEAPPPDAPGRRFYSNLAFFLGDFAVPHGSSDAEKGLYIGLMERMDAAGNLKAGVKDRVVSALRAAARGY